MQSAIAATLTTPEWWAMALAGFLVRGGILLVLVPILALPTPAGFITDVSPTIEALVLGTPTLAGTLLAVAVTTMVVTGLAWAGLAGAWFDVALVREAATSDELDVDWQPVPVSSSQAFGLRLLAHLPTVVALGYAIMRIVLVSYQQFTAPDDPGVPILDRVVGRVPDAVAAVVVTWLAGEVVGGLALRRATAGVGVRSALAGSYRQLLHPRGLATFVATSAILAGVGVPFALAVGRAWEHLRSYLLFGADVTQLTAALVVLVSTWVLGLVVLGAALALRATAWTAEVRSA
jgi:hypothetical protein